VPAAQWALIKKRRAHRALGVKIQRARRAAALTQEAAAVKSGISYSFISQCENGYYCMTVPMLIVLAKTYGTTVSAMLEGL
jgi:DNA-binding XRE family transcriptional regulator